MDNPSSRKPPHAGAPSTGTDDDLLRECRVETFRSGGPGGQNQNKVESGVRLTHRATGIVVASRRHRSQHRNRQDALRRLRRKIEALGAKEKPRIPTRVPRTERRKRLEGKRRRSRLKRLRAKPPPDD